jgi:hypothetical protein
MSWMITAHEAIVQGLKLAEAKGLTKHADIALMIDIALDGAGLRITRKPGHKTNFDNRHED